MVTMYQGISMMKGPQDTNPTPTTAQIHIRVPSDFKKAVKIYCIRLGTTEQAWIFRIVEAELARQASDLWPSPTQSAPSGASVA
jgi:hypothetical protein